MFENYRIQMTLIIALVFALVGCESLPGTREQQGAAIGGAAGAATGAAVSDNRLLGAIIGGVIGAGGGYVIAARTDATDEDRVAAAEAGDRAQRNPATAEEALNARTADINEDGFVTMDEIIALNDAGLNDGEIIRRLEATDQVFELTEAQEDDLAREGVSQTAIAEMHSINRDLLYGSPSSRDDVISRQPDRS